MGANIIKSICCIRKNECFYDFKAFNENKSTKDLNTKIEVLTNEINNQKKINNDLEKKYKNMINLYENINLDYVNINSPRTI